MANDHEILAIGTWYAFGNFSPLFVRLEMNRRNDFRSVCPRVRGILKVDTSRRLYRGPAEFVWLFEKETQTIFVYKRKHVFRSLPKPGTHNGRRTCAPKTKLGWVTSGKVVQGVVMVFGQRCRGTVGSNRNEKR